MSNVKTIANNAVLSISKLLRKQVLKVLITGGKNFCNCVKRWRASKLIVVIILYINRSLHCTPSTYMMLYVSCISWNLGKERLKSINMAVLLKLIYRFNIIVIKIPVVLFSLGPEMDRLILKFIWNCKGPWIAKIISKKKNKVGALTHSNF